MVVVGFLWWLVLVVRGSVGVWPIVGFICCSFVLSLGFFGLLFVLAFDGGGASFLVLVCFCSGFVPKRNFQKRISRVIRLNYQTYFYLLSYILHIQKG